MRRYTTVQGDMWDLIAHTQLGGVEHTDKLQWANRQYLDYYIFPAGIALDLPEIEAPVPDALPPWRRMSA